jgi:hypothetical protein
MPSISHISTPFVNLTTSNVNLTIPYVNNTNFSANMTDYIILEVETEKSLAPLVFVILLGTVVLIAITILCLGIIKEDKRVQDWVNWVKQKKQGL